MKKPILSSAVFTGLLFLIGCQSDTIPNPSPTNATVKLSNGAVQSHGVSFPPEAIKAGALGANTPK